MSFFAKWYSIDIQCGILGQDLPRFMARSMGPRAVGDRPTETKGRLKDWCLLGQRFQSASNDWTLRLISYELKIFEDIDAMERISSVELAITRRTVENRIGGSPISRFCEMVKATFGARCSKNWDWLMSSMGLWNEPPTIPQWTNTGIYWDYWGFHFRIIGGSFQNWGHHRNYKLTGGNWISNI